MSQWLVAYLSHPLILDVLSFEIFPSDHSSTQACDKSIMETPAGELLRIPHSMAEFVMCQVNNTCIIEKS